MQSGPAPIGPSRTTSPLVRCCISYWGRLEVPRPPSLTSQPEHAHSVSPPHRTTLDTPADAADHVSDRPHLPASALPPPDRPPPVPQFHRRHGHGTGKLLA